MSDPTRLLLPAPRRIERLAGALRLEQGIGMACALEAESVRLRQASERGFGRIGLDVLETERDRATLTIEHDATVTDQGYVLEILEDRILVRASGGPGAFYAVQTLLLWTALHRVHAEGTAVLPCLRIEDAPSYQLRGVLLDVSRNKVPRLETLFEWIDRLVSLKINHLQLYMEHTFAYAGHEAVWRGWSPFTADDVLRLDAFCRDRFVELAPCQNSFGHLHRWLVHARYRPLAECPEGIAHPFSAEVEPFSLCPTDPRSLDLLADLYDQLLPNFSSRRCNVGCDETIDLGKGRSAAAVRERGEAAVFAEYVTGVHRLLEQRGHQMLYWADFAAAHPEALPLLPEGAVALEWGYEAEHPFAARLAALEREGVEAWVCPGTSSWCSFLGRLDNARGNLQEAAHAGLAHGATGYLITDWGDCGHLQPPPISWPGFLLGADAAWSARSEPLGNRELAAALDAWALPAGAADLGLGRTVVELGNVYRLAGSTPINRSVLFQALHRADLPFRGPALDPVTQDALHEADAVLNEALERLRDATHTTSGALSQTVDELAWAAEITQLAGRLATARLAVGRDVPSPDLDAHLDVPILDRLVRGLLDLDARLTPLWLERFRSGGLLDSRRWLARFRRKLDPRGEYLARAASMR